MTYQPPPPPYLPIKPELDDGTQFEPYTRVRSNTWPSQRAEVMPELGPTTTSQESNGPYPGSTTTTAKKSTSRRNAWGNMSYADLITQAIQSSPDRRLTLSQIYDWMVGTVPYFKDKGEANSSAGWKNSIRHNLSLHNRFMRVQNEGTGKSSWWMLNPDAKPGKAARRRATSMETSKFEKKRGRIKKKLEAIRSGQGTSPSPNSSISEGLDLFPRDGGGGGGTDLSPAAHVHTSSAYTDFRTRANSNASSCGGRLSPILGEQWDYSNYIYHEQDSLALGLANSVKLCDYEYGGSSSNSTIGYNTACMQQQQPFQSTSNNLIRTSSGAGAAAAASSAPSPPPHILIGSNYSVTNQQATNRNNIQQRSPRPPDHTPPPPSIHLNGLYHDYPPQPFLHIKTEELDNNFDQLETAGPFVECNVEEVLQGELSLGEGIDFNFGGEEEEEEAQDQQQVHPEQESLHGNGLHYANYNQGPTPSNNSAAPTTRHCWTSVLH